MERQINEDYKRNRIIRRLKIFGILVGILAILAVAFLVIFTMRKVEVNGNTRYSDEQIKAALKAEGSRNAVLYYLENRDIHEIPELIFIERVDISFSMPDTIYIDVVEKTLVGCIEKDDRFYYFDTEGTILEVTDTQKEEVPLMEGAQLENPDVGNKIFVADPKIYSNLLQLSLMLNKYETNIDSVSFDDDGSMNLISEDIKIEVGDGTNLEERISALNSLLKALEGRKGTLDLTNYSSADDATIFRTDEE